ncbi:MAG: aminodeoxychorismate synthase component I [Phycisphaerae bacterium]
MQPIRVTSRITAHSTDPTLFTNILSRTNRPAVLQSARLGAAGARYSLFAHDPIGEVVTSRDGQPDVLRRIARTIGTLPPLERNLDAPPFPGGWIGYCSYEFGANIEATVGNQRRDSRIPLARFMLYDTAAAFDHELRRWWLIAVDWPHGLYPQRPPAQDRMDRLASLLIQGETAHAIQPEAQPESEPTATPGLARDAYIERILRIKKYIAAGDVYQVNLTNRFRVPTSQTPLQTYQRLRELSPSSHAAFLPWKEGAIISSSPELFLALRGRHVVTRPIKGTRPRCADPRLDAANRRELATDPKESAELNMIIDLLRNDLGRVCAYSSVQVTDPGTIERHPTVYHRAATIEGVLQEGRSWHDLLQATFPGGSVTGAPKIRAMQIINELEPTPRGVYCGSIGWIGLDGSMELNVAIRTMLQADGMADIYAGGAIVADSQPDAECAEVSAKAAAMLRAVDVSAAALGVQPAGTTGR